MRCFIKVLAFVGIAFWALCPNLAANVKDTSLQISSLAAPIPVATQAGTLLVYELQIVNSGKDSRHIGLIEVRDQNNQLLSALSGKALLDNSFVYEKNKRIAAKALALKPGMGSFVYVWLNFPTNSKIPQQLKHKIWLVERNPATFEANTRSVDYALNVSAEKPVVLHHPLKGANWVAGAGPSPDSYHRRTILPFEGKFYLSQRYAIDWMQICPDGKCAFGDVRVNTNWNGFGNEIIAVADGVVTKVHDGIPENTPPTLPVPQLSIPNIAGNHIMLKIHQNEKDYFVLFAHMQPGSIRVKLGQKIKQGDIIGLLGNTGNSSAPHLHIHVCDANDPLQAEGVPFVFKEVMLAGKVQDIDPDDGIWSPLDSQHKRRLINLMPLNNEVFDFTDVPAKACVGSPINRQVECLVHSNNRFAEAYPGCS